MQSSSPYSRDSGSAPRQLPSGWWDGVPEGFRKSFDRKTLRHGYLLRLDGFVKGMVFFRNAYCATVLDGEARFVCRYRHEPGNDASLQGNSDCSCARVTSGSRCAHEAALLFRVFTDAAGLSVNGGKPAGEGYAASIWAQLALAITRSHPFGDLAPARHPDRFVLGRVGESDILDFGFGPDTLLDYRAAGLPAGWAEAPGKGVFEKGGFAAWAAREIPDEDYTVLKTMGQTPSWRAEFGPAGELCRAAYLQCTEPACRLDWDDSIRLFRIRLHDRESSLLISGLLSNDQAYSFWKKNPRVELGNGFTGNEDAWPKGLEIRVAEGGRIRIRPFTGSGARFYPPLEGEGLRFGDKVLLPGSGFRKLQAGSASLSQRFSGWKIYWIDSAAVPGFLSKYGDELASGPEYDLDPLLGHPQAAAIRSLVVGVHGHEEGRFRISLEYHMGAARVDLGRLKSLLDSGQSSLITTAGWVDFTMAEWSWAGQLKAQQWCGQDEGTRILIDSALLTRICVMHAPEAIRVEPAGSTSSQSASGLEFLAGLTGEGPEAADPEMDIPITGLRTYQVEGLRWLIRLASSGLSGILADDMGLGKTHQVMALFAWAHRRSQGRDRILVICPTSVLYHWKEKIDAFHPDLDAGVFHGAQRDLGMLEKEICITSYGIARNDMALLRRREYGFLILDEIQYSKNRESGTHQALRSFPARSVIGLSGTPLENNVWEVKNLFDLILPGYFPGEGQFRKYIADPLESGSGAEGAQNRFRRLTRPFMLRRLKADVSIDLPEKAEETYTCDLAPDQAELYRACLKRLGGPLLRELSGQGKPSLLHVFQLLNLLKQICNHPMTLAGAEAPEREYRSGKWDLFAFLLEKSLAAGHKVVVFSQYLGMLEWIEKHLRKSDIGFATLTGATRDRPAVLKRFAGDPLCRVFCCSLKAGGVGIDLTAAETVIHYDRWWNAARENQATDRVHRIGQSKNVRVFKLVSRGTIEERIDAIIRKKAAWMDALVPGDPEGGLKLFTREELIELLRGDMEPL